VVLLPVPASPTAERFAGRPIEPGKTASLTTWICVPREQPKK
jgi:hypothetical protein